ncbi:MAG: hypothetical protein JXR59_08830 [Desulfuromonadaceae bacterium]|nr:hypothetical protein [Desulfuromonadaceae bacterium]
MAIVAAGGAFTHFFVAVFAQRFVGGVFVNGNFSRSSITVASSVVAAASISFMGFVVEGNVTFFALVGNNVSSQNCRSSKGNQHQSNDQLFHVSSSWDLNKCAEQPRDELREKFSEGQGNFVMTSSAGTKLFFMALSALDRTTHLLVTQFAHFAVGRFFIDDDFGRGAFAVAGRIGAAVGVFSVGLVVEGDRAFGAVFGIDNNIGRQGCGGSECDEQQGDEQFFHGAIPPSKK